MTTLESTIDLDTTRHNMVFEPREFNPRRVAIIGTADEIVWLFALLCRLGVRNFAIYCNDPVEDRINIARRAVERPGVELFNVEYRPGKIEAVLNGPRAAVLFIAHEEPQRRALCAKYLSVSLAAREAVFIQSFTADELQITALDMRDIENRGNLPTAPNAPVGKRLAGHRLFVAAHLAYAFLSWWRSLGTAFPQRDLLGPHVFLRRSSTTGLQYQRPLTARELSTPVDVVGLGAIGSWTVMGLLLEGFTNVRGYDADIVSSHNIPNQAFYRSDEGLNKAIALSRVAASLGLSGYYPQPRMVNLAEEKLAKRIVLVTDNQGERAKLFQRADAVDGAVVIDARMGVSNGIVHTCQMTNREDAVAYSRALLSAHRANQEPDVLACHLPTLGPVGVALSAVAVGQVVQSIAAESDSCEISRNLTLSNGVLIDERPDEDWPV